MLNKTFIAILILVVLSKCSENTLNNEYTAFFYETEWVLAFDTDGTYSLSSYGHAGAGGVDHEGKYSVIENGVVA